MNATAPIRVLLLCERLDVAGGVERFVCELANHLAGIGLRVAVGSVDTPAARVRYPLAAGVQVFGVPIASFQALRHRMADVKMQLELARSMGYYASLQLASPPEVRRRALAQARLQLGEAMRFVGQQCVQLHGGIGVTDEYIGSHCFKRLTVLSQTWGDTLHALGEVSARMLDTAGVSS